ncbi:Glycine dehydrogenase (decarboxylating) [Nymphon striatum]|nr:Glycine dehydrogenase (decarboxylating) [Nymphon striatum]
MQGVVQVPTGGTYDPYLHPEIGEICLHGNPNAVTRDVGTSSLAQGPSSSTTLVRVEKLIAAARNVSPRNARLRTDLELGFNSIRDETLSLDAPLTESQAIARIREIADENEVFTSLIGTGYHGTITPAVLRRNILENPACQGRLEALFNFQTMVADLSGLDIANASLLDEGTAAAEAMQCTRKQLAVLQTRAEPIGIEIRVADRNDPIGDDVFGVLFQYPGTTGQVYDLAPLVAAAHEAGALTAVAADILSLVLLKSPGECGADVVVGSTQRFGVPMGCGGPHAAFIAAREGAQRSLPGRVVGMSVDAEGRPALRLALQTREQHIRREKATSNICTAQVLLAVMAAMYASYHGPDGLRSIAQRVHGQASKLAAGLQAAGFALEHDTWFDTVTVVTDGRAAELVAAAAERRINVRHVDNNRVSMSFDETCTDETVSQVLAAFSAAPGGDEVASPISSLLRTDEILDYEPFHRFRTETQMLRYLRYLSDKDIALDRSMIPLGSCTMKLNATTEMEPITWPEFANIHPFAPATQRRGYERLVQELETMLSEITGYAASSQGYSPFGRGIGQTATMVATVCLIPSSAHGTNAASAVMAGMRVVVVACNENGDVDVSDLRAQIEAHRSDLAAIMVTYPSTHGVFETAIVEICELVHEAGGQVYVDGANLNALVGLARPGRFGADVSHLNLHKTFCIPHGGGGPGVGPVAVGEHLIPFLPGHPILGDAAADGSGIRPTISAAPWGSAGILAIPYLYIAMMGAEELRNATKAAIVSANYIATRLEPHFPVLYRGHGGYVAHECILDLRPMRDSTDISVDDVAKRLVDYGFHAPTMSFPVAGTLMVEPTESESLQEIDRFCDAMIAIAHEAAKVEAGEWPADDNPLVHAPHTAEAVTADEWNRAYSRQEGAYPTQSSRQNKIWPPVARIDGAHGDRNFICSCPPLEELAQAGASA